MYLHLLMALMAFAILTAQVLAAPIEPFIAAVAKKAGRPADEIRRNAVEALRLTKKVSGEELERIGRGGDPFSPARESELVKLLQRNMYFRVASGLESVRLAAIQKGAGREFEKFRSSNPVQELKGALTSLAMLETQISVTALQIRGHEAAVGRGEVAAVTELAKARQDIRELGLRLEEAKTHLLPAITNALLAARIPFELGLFGNRPVIRLDGDSVIDVRNIGKTQRYAQDEKTHYLGLDFLQRINSTDHN